MRKTSKVMVILLAVALAFGCFTATIFGYDASYENYSEVLEYYETDIYVNEQFDTATNLETSALNSDSATDTFKYAGAINSGDSVTDGVLTITKKAAAHNMHIAPSNSVNYGINLGISFGVVPTKAITFTFYNYNIIAGAPSGATTISHDVLTISEDGAVSYLSGVTEGTPTYTDANLSIEADVFYDISLFVEHNGADGSEISVIFAPRATDATPLTFTAQVAGFTAESMKLNINYAASGKNVSFDYVEAYEGNFARRLCNLEDTVAEYINDLVALYESDTDAADALEILKTVNSVIITHGYDAEKITDAALKAATKVSIEKNCTYLGNIYAENLIDEAADINSSAAYNVRLALVKILKEYNVLVSEIQQNYPSITLEADRDALAAAQAAYADEFEALEAAKANTLSHISATNLITDAQAATYSQIKECYSLIANTPIDKTYYDDTVTNEAVLQSYNKGLIIIERYTEAEQKADNYIQGTRIAADTENNFVTRYNAYITARDNLFYDATYDEPILGTDTMDTIKNLWLAVEAEMLLEISNASAFMDKVDEANAATSYSVKLALVDEAEDLYAEAEPTFPGVSDKLALCQSIKQTITEKNEAAVVYINAVLAISNAKTYAAKKSAVSAATALAEGGADISLVVTVTVDGKAYSVIDANKLLSDATTEIVFLEKYSANVIAKAAAIENAKTLSELSAAILEAVTLIADADETYAGVAEAVSKINSAFDSYNAAVRKANEVQTAAATTAVSTVNATLAEGAAITKTVAIIKKFYE